ncbi:hypothetical protein [Salibacterium sp. K-3]
MHEQEAVYDMVRATLFTHVCFLAVVLSYHDRRAGRKRDLPVVGQKMIKVGKITQNNKSCEKRCRMTVDIL